MPISDLLVSGVELMLIGMGIVFIFLGLMSRISHALDKDDITHGSDSVAQFGKPDNTALIAVITAAVTRFRANH
jgi:Na+-transporting methylmalonyl-CoA/oxaloacetate decarboxylase gamma subunit